MRADLQVSPEAIDLVKYMPHNPLQIVNTPICLFITCSLSFYYHKVASLDQIIITLHHLIFGATQRKSTITEKIMSFGKYRNMYWEVDEPPPYSRPNSNSE